MKIIESGCPWMRYGEGRQNKKLPFFFIDLLALFDFQLFACNTLIKIKLILFISGKPIDMFISPIKHFRKFNPLAVIFSICFPIMLNVCYLTLTVGLFSVLDNTCYLGCDSHRTKWL